MGKPPKLSHKQTRELQAIITTSDSKGPEVRRAQTILLIDQGTASRSLRAMTGFGRTRSFILRKRYLAEGIAAVQDHREGTPKELLTRKQREEIIETVKTKAPRDCMRGYDHEFWSAALLGRYIKDTYKVVYKSRTSYQLMFRKAEFSYHKPGRVSERRDEEEVRKWRRRAKKRVATAWNDPNTVVLVEDEMHLSNQTTVQKIWLPKGAYPEITVTRKRDSRSVYGFLDVKTGVEHAWKTRWQNMYITAEIIPNVRALYPGKKILLIWDQAGSHKGSEAQRAIKDDGNIETLYFPTAAPEENPQEHVWKAGRSATTHNEFIQDIDAGTDAFVKHLNTATFPYSLLGFSSLS